MSYIRNYTYTHFTILNTIDESDVSLTTTRGRFLPGDVDVPKDVEFSLTVDNIAQEINETFAIVLELRSDDGTDVTIIDRLEVVIIDSDGRLTVQ